MRTNKIVIYVGTRGTGKTDFIKNLMDDFPHSKTLIVDLHDNDVWHTMETHNHPEWVSRKIPIMPVEKLPYHKAGIYRVFSSKIRELEQSISTNCINTSVVFEDATRWFKPNLTDAQKEYILDSKQKNCDLHLVFHNLRKVPLDIVSWADYLVLFKTGEAVYNKDKFYHQGFDKAFKDVFSSSDPFIHRIIRLN